MSEKVTPEERAIDTAKHLLIATNYDHEVRILKSAFEAAENAAREDERQLCARNWNKARKWGEAAMMDRRLRIKLIGVLKRRREEPSDG